MSELLTPESVSFPDQIVTDWRRFSCGLWRIPKGDIDAAYCADTFPKLKVFTHEGRLFTNCGSLFSGPVMASSDCYPLIPIEEYRGPEEARYTYEGRMGVFGKKQVKLGPKVIFAASEPSRSEWRQMLRTLFAEGGHFASGKTYEQFLRSWKTWSDEESAVVQEELGGAAFGRLGAMQKEMAAFIDDEVFKRPEAETQLNFLL